MDAGRDDGRPASATHGLTAAAGLAALLAALLIIYVWRPFGGDTALSALFALSMAAVGLAVPDLVWRKVHRRASTGLDHARWRPSWSRTGCKLVGLVATLGLIVGGYWLFPEYRGAFYDRFDRLALLVSPFWLAAAIPYFYWVDARMAAPEDGYWHMGKIAAFDWEKVDRRIVAEHLLGWLVKAFFLPLMITYFWQDVEKFLQTDVTALRDFKTWYDFLYDTMYLVDVALASVGYMMALRLTDTHLRSAEPTMLGWSVALLCYEPFWSLFGARYLSYGSGYVWGDWLWNSPILYSLWGGCILLLTAVYVWATVCFGGRFSNLTHRGIITGGPYRWTKHPAYIAKNLSWWMISIPFLAPMPWDEALRHCLLLLGLNAVYILRAKTEERHLSRDPDYARYAAWIDRHGLFRFRFSGAASSS